MFYYEVVPADRQYHSEKLLTYSHKDRLSRGQIVVVTLQTKTITGIIIKRVEKPTFKTKPITRILELTLPLQQLDLFNWMLRYYPYGLGVTATLFIPPALKSLKLPEQLPTLPTQLLPINLPILSDEQQQALRDIKISDARTHIVHGDTGTGKTRLYIELAKQAIQQGKSVLILTPEISLTPQLIRRFSEVFSHIHIVHSQISPVRRRETWRCLQATSEPQIVIGPRSALFMPLPKIGLVVVDEFHDHAYKQEQSPRYHAVRVAAKLAELYDAKLVLGSATPPIEDYFYATKKGARVYRLTNLPGQSAAVRTTKVVDLSKDSERSAYSLLSTSLLSAISKTLENKEQVLIFHNKRGSLRSVLCSNCGWQALCNRCNIPYTYHADSHSFLCHTCGNSEPTPNNCPDCGASEIIFKGPGTKAIAETLKKLFPEAKLGRYDKDNTKEESFNAQQSDIERGDVDILVGTQLLAKGHDLPNLSLVGVLLAETGLQFPDFGSEERSYQLLHQLSGRVGRGHRAGTVILQTFNPGQKTLEAAEHKKDAWEDFYRNQLSERRQFAFPPYCFMLKIECARKTEKSARSTAEKLAESLSTAYPNIEVLGPTPAFIAKQADTWRWQIIIKSFKRSELLTIIHNLPKNTTYDLDPLTLL